MSTQAKLPLTSMGGLPRRPVKSSSRVVFSFVSELDSSGSDGEKFSGHRKLVFAPFVAYASRAITIDCDS